MADKTTTGLWLSLALLLGVTTFHKNNSAGWSTIFASGSELADDLRAEIERIKDFRTRAFTLQHRTDPPPASALFDAPSAGFGHGLSKLQNAHSMKSARSKRKPF
jgi:hypothetical protein